MTVERRRTIAAYLAQHCERLGGSPMLNFPESYIFQLSFLSKDDMLDDSFFAHFKGQSHILLGQVFDEGRVVGWTVQ